MIAGEGSLEKKMCVIVRSAVRGVCSTWSAIELGIRPGVELENKRER